MAVNLKAILGFDGKAYEAGMKKATATSKKAQKNIVGNLKSQIGGVLAVGFITSKAKAIGEFAREVRDLAPALGMTTDSLQEWEYVFARFGLELEDVSDAFATLADRTEDALSGTQSMIEDFSLIGISVEQLRGKNPQQLFELFADAVQNTSDRNRSLTAIVRNLGDDLGRKLAPALMLGSKGLAEMRKEAEELGIVMETSNIEAVADKVIEMQIASMKLRSFWADITFYASKLVTYLSDGLRFLNPFNQLIGGLGGAFGHLESGGKLSGTLGAFYKGAQGDVSDLLDEVNAREEAAEKRRKQGMGSAPTRSARGINYELEAKKAQEAYQKKVNSAVFKGLDNEGKLNALLEKRAALMEKIKNASGKKKYELMGEQFDTEQQMESLKTGASAGAAGRTQSLTGAQGVGAFVKRANPMLQVARQQLQIQRESKFVLDAILAAGYRPAYGPY